MDQTYMKEKKILPLVLSMSYPMMLSMAVGFAIGINAVVSYYLGAGKLRRAHEAATTG